MQLVALQTSRVALWINNVENFYKRVNSKNSNQNAKIANNILRVGKHSSSNFFRVYLKPNGKELRFEIELKKTVVKNF